MSAVDERGALDPAVSLFEYATRLHEQNPTVALPNGGRPYPDEPAESRRTERRASAAEYSAALLALLDAYLRDESTSVRVFHDGLCRLDLSMWAVESALDKLPTLDTHRARQTGTWLVRHAYDRSPTMVGLALLARSCRPDDAPLIRTIGLLDRFGPMAVRALATLPDATLELTWLAERSGRYTRIKAVKALCERADPPAIAWLRRHAVSGDEVRASLARQVAEVASLADALETHPVEDDIFDQAGELLLAMVAPNDYSTQLARYRYACRVYTALARHADSVQPSMRRYAMLLCLIEELRTGYAACLEWRPGQREQTLAQLSEVVGDVDWHSHLVAALKSSDSLIRRQANWAQYAITTMDAVDPVPQADDLRRFRIAVVVPDPFRHADVQTRVLADDWPVIAAAFDKGPPFPPEVLLAHGDLRAMAEPHEVRLAEAYCTEGCCGALYVTIVQDGGTVIWRDWAGYTSPAAPPELRFSAAQYHTELARAQTDYSWEWPARTIARLLRARLVAEPDLLTRWQCHTAWIVARAGEPSQLRFSFFYPQRPSVAGEGHWLQFERVLTMDSAPEQEQATRIAQQFETVDPKTHSRVVGGRRDSAEHLGYMWPDR